MRFIFSTLALLLTLTLSAQQVIITGIVDGTQTNQTPRAIELYVDGTVDLSGFRIERAANANSFPDATLNLSGTYTDAFVYLINNDAGFTATFGSSGDFGNRILDNSFVSGNGNDRFRLVQISNSAVIDQTGGNSDVNIYLDSYIYRNDNTGPDGGWVAANWQNVGMNDVLDGLSYPQIAAAVPFGTYSRTPAGPSVNAIAAGNLAEPTTDGGFSISLSQTASVPVTVTYTLGGTATAGADYNDLAGGTVSIPAGFLSAPINLEVIDDLVSEQVETIILSFVAISDPTFSLGNGATVSITDNEAPPATLISAVQGSGASSPLIGQTVTIQGVVVGDFQGGSGVGLGGFFVQEEDVDADGNPLTSEGVWVFDSSLPGSTAVAVGDVVTVTGVVGEASNLTQINVTGAGASVIVNGTTSTLPSAASLDLPVANTNDYEAFEGMRTLVLDDVSITETFGIARFGEFVVSEGERLIQFTECNDPDPAGLAAYNATQSLRRLIVDDGRSGDNNYPIILGDGSEVSATNSLRSGTVLTGLTGVIDQRFGSYRMQATDFIRSAENERPAAAPPVGGELKVVGMNVLNYFTTLGSRGADNAAELQRQQDKIVLAICELDADIIGLIEIENNGYGPGSALRTLINAVSAECGKTYTWVVAPNSGSDQIQVALIYKSAVVAQSGTAASLAVPAPVFGQGGNRVPLAQTFEVIQAGHPNFGQEITVCVNHWKSKGSSCGSGDDDNGGAGNCNGTRVAAAEAIRDWLASDPTGTGETDQLIIGDLNAYSQEPPIQTMLNAGFVNTVRDQAGAGSFPCGSVPSYVFMGEWGSLDHALASASLASKVTGATPWDVNSSEPTALDYDTEFNNPALYNRDFYRFSDHDPIVVGLDLGSSLPVELAAFEGRVAGKEVVLEWRSLSERGTDRFEIERRGSAGDFVAIGSVRAAGDSGAMLEYTFTDVTPLAGPNSYRLRMVDTDGSFAYSNIINLQLAGGEGLRLDRMPGGAFQLSGAPVGSRFLLSDAAGAVLGSDFVTAEATRIGVDTLPAGVYFLAVRLPNGRFETLKFVR
ncbi:ExeM/NucH family extracellular endonuclease [Neolewinella lacunae]|uniref:ExeM/NucH family extracellular endonuclease n=1 Tax=Neolewinella lacunae TaxID=1517758 RepID=A0A923TAS9_9BACT|nr:ExeM/NucH family extracellular endonuclease [Neolewinella lacunae]MBC6996508.1 ExeM/NucH family extracellular endonuclease [Neolewinella lacunae]MDN3636661.1 ExeM/NucH family extracellular endonuclease [Neolewinella lacunae]